ncbi:hypothetical protein MJ904_07890 [Massilia sp. MB5]|uniref:hypothetical protein n=1 Tax=Massilia sp. MB5 TaxID=2919578 RepID=UPI001F116BAB|nr:hypothetical protein [Massilia sp. MB5]UMR32086.1 hypothetical protein MJ904_07890 [Massilia sp. MB5]
MQHTFPLDPWCIRETGFDTASNFLDETLFALGNGYIGQRGTHEEGYSGPDCTTREGNFLNGFYESEPIQYPENAYGLARTNQFMLNVPNLKGIALWIEDECFDLLQGSLDSYERILDFRTGQLVRKLEWTSPQGRRVAITSRRIVCFDNKHLFAISYEVTPLNFSGRVWLVSSLDGVVKNQEAGDDPRVGSAVSGPSLEMEDAQQWAHFSALLQRTHNSGFKLASAELSGVEGPHELQFRRNGLRLEQSYAVAAQQVRACASTNTACITLRATMRKTSCLAWPSKPCPLPRRKASRYWRSARKRIWPISGSRPTLKSRATTRSSKAYASTSSTCCNRWAATARRISRPRG